MYLIGGQAYYFEAIYSDYSGRHFITVGLHKDTTTLTNADVPMSVKEEQELIIYSTKASEKQVCMYRNKLFDPSLTRMRQFRVPYSMLCCIEMCDNKIG